MRREVDRGQCGMREIMEKMRLAGEMQKLDQYTTPENKTQYQLYKNLMTEDLKSSRRDLPPVVPREYFAPDKKSNQRYEKY